MNATQNPNDPDYSGQQNPQDSDQSAPSSNEAARAFGGEPVGSEPARERGRRGPFTCLVIVLILGVLGVFALFVVASLAHDFLTAWQMPKMPQSGDVGIVKVSGMINGNNRRYIRKVVDEYKKDKDLRAVVVRVDSGGGTVGDSQEIYQMVKDLREQGKRVVVSMANTAASGGYYSSLGAEEIFTNPGTLTASIGVIMTVPNFKELSKKVGVDVTTIKSGDLKGVPSMTKEMTERERAYLQKVIGDTHDQFYQTVLENRREALKQAATNLRQTRPDLAAEIGGGEITPERLLKHIADGRVMTGRQAVELGLADKLGSFEDAIDRVAEMAGIDKPKAYEYQPPFTLRDLFGSGVKSVLNRVELPIEGARLEYRMAF